ncbi:MAG TPA: PHB depolymerase family esterase [Polyangiaceae bacterium]|nr:PHB depolymerase family esterase [Polyangiaceae bacterium]
MNRFRAQVLAAASLSAGLLAPARGSAASLVEVNRSDWAGSVKLPSYMQMYIYVPDKLATKPPIMVSSHSCGSTATGQLGNIPISKAAADKYGFILILPDNPGQNCWDVGTSASLTHDGGGDTQGVAQMVKYALMKYGGDPGRVYAMGGSGGGMMTQALMAVYPDVFRAGSARAGVPAGCWADGYASSNQWSDNCANGNTIKTAQQWGDLVRAMDPGYTGHRPRIQTMQGEADQTISYKNTGESIKEWTNVLGLPTDPTSSDKGYKAANATYDRQFWANACGYNVLEAWSSPGGTHSMPYEEADILKFFGLDAGETTDPEPDCNGMGGSGGMGGAPGSGGMSGATSAGGGRGPSGGTGAGGMGGAGGTMSAAAGTGVMPASGGTGGGANGTGGSGTGGAPGTGGTSAMGAGGSTGGTIANGAAGRQGGGGAVSSSGGSGGASGTGTSSPGTGGGDDSGKESGGCGIAGGAPQHPFSAFAGLGLALFAFRRRKRRATS